ncbi:MULTISPECIES: conjugal transfer protein TraF [unclassified Lactobacillus]|uniref:TlpA family protein disulfide reductase n=1 Tax=unclassified Lactobacillus TaxID=2620435 RepID=UPI000EFD5F1F|nr:MULTISPECIES: conjugal transfer protein TraF [unclassified Lactobacillus]RMC38113.1 thioredoxin [Lactobacillus sp. ESL0237]RMC42634.1 thioredoxin [Lactobacillus sp. ESL0234]RMC43341.1 thioredoxin [Lactobacillus sp. ESL0236]RMC47846.1 thioredoxin [Lactobacillus sp. ESL0225]
MINKIVKRLVLIASLFLILGIAIIGVNNYIAKEREDRSAVKIEKKASILFFYRDDCPNCKHVFLLVNLFEKLGTPVQYINTNNGQNHEKAINNYHVSAVPTFILINRNGNEIKRYTGSNFDNIRKFFTKKVNKISKVASK